MSWLVRRAIKKSLPADEWFEQYITVAKSDHKKLEIAATQRRLVICFKRSWLRYRHREYPWNMLAKVALNERLFGGGLEFETKGGEKFLVESMVKSQARTLCSYARRKISEIKARPGKDGT